MDDDLNRAYSFSLMALAEANLPTLAANITRYGESLVPATSKPVGRATMLRRLEPVLSVFATWEDWQSGSEELSKVRAHGQWADGSPFGVLHHIPCLQPIYARHMKAGAQQAPPPSLPPCRPPRVMVAHASLDRLFRIQVAR